MKTNLLHKGIIKVFTVLLTIFLSSCVTTSLKPSKIIIASNNVGYGANRVLDIKFTQVTIPRVRASSALSLLTKSIANTPEKISRFSWEIEPEPHSPKGLTEQGDRWVKINQTNTTLRQVLDELCKQAGWRYEECAIGILFIAPSK